MEAATNPSRPRRRNSPFNQERDPLKRHYDYYDHALMITLLDLQEDMELRGEYDHKKADDLGKEILKNEDDTTDSEQHGDLPAPYHPRLRQSLLRKTALLYLYGRHIIPNYNKSLDDCIRRHNDLELQTPSGDEGKPQLISYAEIQEDYGKMREKADEYLHQQRWTTQFLGKIGTALASYSHGRKR